jgi:hypothetical protein
MRVKHQILLIQSLIIVCSFINLNAQVEIDSASEVDYWLIDKIESDSVENDFLSESVFKKDDPLNFTEEYQKQKDSDYDQKESDDNHNKMENRQILHNDIIVKNHINRQMLRDQFYFERRYRMRQIEYRRRMNLYNSQIYFMRFNQRLFRPRR